MATANTDNNNSSTSSHYTVPPTHRLHPAYSHPVLASYHTAFPILPSDLVYPLFITTADSQAKQAIQSLPNQYRWGVDRLVEECLPPLIERGLSAVLLFGVVEDDKLKDTSASFATSQHNPVVSAVKLIRQKFSQLLVMVDICLCAYTSHGHCGVLHADGSIDNAASLSRFTAMSIVLAEAGAHVVAPSDMMDGRVGAIRAGLVLAGLEHRTAIMSYSAKFASCFYGPFRDAAASGCKSGNRSRYQLPVDARSLALRAIQRDVEEGAQFIMIKPGLPYLDIIRDAVNLTNNTIPLAVYQVSGEYASLCHAAEAGSFQLIDAVLESLSCCRRAGAKILITYFTPLLLEYFATEEKKRRS